MNDFDLKKYLAENKLLKEEDILDNIVDKLSKLGDYNETEKGEKIFDYIVQKYIEDGKTIYTIFRDRGEKTDSYSSPDFESSNLKDVIDFLTNFPELEDEYRDTMEGAIERPEVYLQNIINASDEEIVSDNYYEIKNAVDDRRYTKEKAVELAKAWAKNKLENLNESLH